MKSLLAAIFLTALTALSLTALAAQSPPNVYLENNEIFIDRGSARVQLTHDGISKSEPSLSPDHSRILYATTCDQQHPRQCPPEIVVLDLKGNRRASFPAIGKDGPCNSLNQVEWIDSRRIGLDCHVNPSLGAYDEIDAESGHSRGGWLGYWFTWSPDRTKLAHVGWIPHFAPPSAKSNYLQFGGTNVYPNGKPAATNAAEPPDTVTFTDGVFHGIHEFLPPLSWSPDSKRVALVERIYDWRPDGDRNSNAGEELKSRYQLVIASEKQPPILRAIPEPTTRIWKEAMASDFHIAWLDASSLKVAARGQVWTFVVESSTTRLRGAEKQ